ncbi:flippase [Pediococcus inopinatus]|uniref:flippase n=1 Tax=Pediococcus inopinatus TaxID=114090 RepID=UPI0007C44081|nr:flippase [Pediococcus inopinatus]
MKVMKNFIYNASYQLFILIVPLITTPYISRVLGSEGVGINAYTNSIIQYFVLLGSIGISTYGNRQIAYQRNNKETLSQTFWEITVLRIITICIAYTAFLVYLSITSEFKFYFVGQSFQIIAAALDISWLFMGLENFKRTVIRNFLVKFISIICIFTLIKKSSDLGTYILILSLSTLIGNVSLWGYLKKTVFKPVFSEFHIWKHLAPSISLFIPQIAIQIYLVLNKTMLGNISGVKSAGYFEYSDRIVKMVLAIVTSLGTVMMPRIASVFAAKQYEKLRKYLYMSGDFTNFLSIPMAFGLAGIAPRFGPWFMGKEFEITGKLISIEAIVIFLIGWGALIGTQYLIPTNQIGKYTWAVSISAIINLVLNVPLISKFGVVGATFATVASEISSTGLQLFFVRKQLNLGKLFYGFWKYCISGLLMFCVVRYMNINTKMSIINLSIQVGSGILVYFSGIFLLRAPFSFTINKFLKHKL